MCLKNKKQIIKFASALSRKDVEMLEGRRGRFVVVEMTEKELKVGV